MSDQPERQRQKILSPDGKLEILHHAASIDQFGCYTLKGALRNATAESDVEAEIRVDYYDSQGTRIDSEIDVLLIPFAGGSRAFHIIYPGQRHDDIKGYRVYPAVRRKT
jgi:hypothetical protein